MSEYENANYSKEANAGCFKRKRWGILFYQRYCVRCHTLENIGCKIWNLFICWRSPMNQDSRKFLQMSWIPNVDMEPLSRAEPFVNMGAHKVDPHHWNHIYDMLEGKYFVDSERSQLIVERIRVGGPVGMRRGEEVESSVFGPTIEYQGYALGPKRYYLVIGNEKGHKIKVELTGDSAHRLYEFRKGSNPPTGSSPKFPFPYVDKF